MLNWKNNHVIPSLSSQHTRSHGSIVVARTSKQFYQSLWTKKETKSFPSMNDKMQPMNIISGKMYKHDNQYEYHFSPTRWCHKKFMPCKNMIIQTYCNNFLIRHYSKDYGSTSYFKRPTYACMYTRT